MLSFFVLSKNAFKASARTLEVFLSHRWKVDVVHVFRPYERAVRGVLDRAAKEGRYVGLGPGRSMSVISCAAQDVFWQLSQRFAGRANFFVFRTVGEERRLEQLPIESLAPGGEARHPEGEALWAAERAAMASFLAGGGSPRIINVSLHGMTGRGE